MFKEILSTIISYASFSMKLTFAVWVGELHLATFSIITVESLFCEALLNGKTSILQENLTCF